MSQNVLLFSIFLIFTGAAILSTAALYTRQSLLVAYMLLGIALGPWGLKWVADSTVIAQIGDVGIIFLLFLLGLHLQPQNLWHMFKKVSLVAFGSFVILGVIGFFVGRIFHYNNAESIIIGVAVTFSSTIIGLKLLPTTVLHHQHTGEIMIGVLLLQDLIAILALLFIQGASVSSFDWMRLGSIGLFFPLLLFGAFFFEKYVLRRLFRHFDKVREYMFLLAIAWCLSLAEVAHVVGLSGEIGAFIAGVTIATSPIANYIADSLRPIRDFFLVLFFFSIGATFDLTFFVEVVIPSVILAVVLLVAKPVVFRALLSQAGEPKHVAWEVGMRLGQASEFSILVAYIGVQEFLISEAAATLIQMVTLLTFVVSSYVVVLRYPTPVAMSDKLRRD